MSFLKPTVIVVTGLLTADGGVHWGERAHDEACMIFARHSRDLVGIDLEEFVTELGPRDADGHRSFAVLWDGSKEGWPESKAADDARADFVQWLRDQEYEDGSSPLRWVELSYADDDGYTNVLATSADTANARRARSQTISLDLGDPLQPAVNWAAADGVSIRDPDGWRSGTDELPPLDFDAPVSRQEYEARLAASTVVQVRA